MTLLQVSGHHYQEPSMKLQTMRLQGLSQSVFNLQYLTLKESESVSLSRVRLFATPWTVARQVPLSMEFSRQEYWSGLPFPTPADLLDPGIKPTSPVLSGEFFTTGSTREGLFPTRWYIFQYPKVVLRTRFLVVAWQFVVSIVVYLTNPVLLDYDFCYHRKMYNKYHIHYNWGLLSSYYLFICISLCHYSYIPSVLFQTMTFLFLLAL